MMVYYSRDINLGHTQGQISLEKAFGLKRKMQIYLQFGITDTRVSYICILTLRVNLPLARRRGNLYSFPHLLSTYFSFHFSRGEKAYIAKSVISNCGSICFFQFLVQHFIFTVLFCWEIWMFFFSPKRILIFETSMGWKDYWK